MHEAYKVTGFSKELTIDSPEPYGFIVIYFGTISSYKKTGRISLDRFLALSHILENDSVAYNPITKQFITNFENSKFVNPPDGEIA